MDLENAIDTQLDLVGECSTFYLREMLAHLGSPLARKRHADQVARLAPKLAAYLFAIVGGELRYLGSNGDEGAGLTCGCHCESCHWDDGQAVYRGMRCSCTENGDQCYHSYNGHAGKRRDYNSEKSVGSCGYENPGDQEPVDFYAYKLSDEMLEFLEEYGVSSGNGRDAAWSGWWRWQRNGGSAVDMLNEAARLFDEGDWGYGFGGEAWGTIAKLARDYYAGKVKPATFVDRVWSIEHNGGNAFDKMYGPQASELATVLEEQAADNYTVLCKHADNETATMWTSRGARKARTFYDAVIPEFHGDRDDVWRGVQRTYEEVW